MGTNLTPGNLTLYGNLDANGVNTVVEPTVDMSVLFGAQFADDNVAVVNSAQLSFGFNSLQITGAQVSTSNFSFADAAVQNNGVYGVLVQQGTDPNNGNLLTVNNIIDYTLLDQNLNPIPGDTFQAELWGWNQTGAVFQVFNPFVIPSSAAQKDGSVFATDTIAEHAGPNQQQYIYFSFDNLDVSPTLNLQNGTLPPQFPLSFTDQGPSPFLNFCFAPGTLIRTAGGDVPVEALQAGDNVLTVDGHSLRVRRIGAWDVDAENPDHAGAGPVEIAAHAFGPGLPERPLFLSADHAVFVDGFLVPVRGLINGRSIRQHPVGAVQRYHHVLLDSHAVLFANGMPAESFLDVGQASMDWPFPVASAGITSLTLAWEVRAYAPLLVAGPALRAMRSRLARQHENAPPVAVAA